MYSIEYYESWDKHFVALSPDIQKRIWKKIQQIKNGLPGRHLEHGLPVFVEEVGQYRICYVQNEQDKIRRICFVGAHKEYEKWFRSVK